MLKTILIFYRRWCVLTLTHLYSFKSEQEYSSPTEEMDVSTIKTIKSDENTSTNIFVHIYP
jgi:hypothetical protein